MGKNVGIMTFHYADNYGAVLQTYALRKVINSFEYCSAKIINYVPENYQYFVFSGDSMIEKQKSNREKFNKFLSEYCGINVPMVHSVIGNEYDTYIVGSDQVWNVDLPIVSADYEYFLPHLDENAKRIAYSASIGMEIERIDKELFQKYLTKFDKISLREKSYTKVISELSGKNCEYTLDPTMLLNKKEYESVVKKPDEVIEPYLLYFWYDMGDGGFESVETVNLLAKKYGLSVKHTFPPKEYLINHLITNNAGCMLYDGICEFLWYIKNATLVVTNSFHGAVISLIFQKPLYIYYPRMRCCRQENLVDLLNLQDRVLQGYVEANKLNLEMDYKAINSSLKKEKEKSLLYLKNAIGIV